MGREELRRLQTAIKLIVEIGNIDGAWHKQWLLDQIVRILSGAAYEVVVSRIEKQTRSDWDTGIAP
jgi:hypothetical protein